MINFQECGFVENNIGLHRLLESPLINATLEDWETSLGKRKMLPLPYP